MWESGGQSRAHEGEWLVPGQVAKNCEKCLELGFRPCVNSCGAERLKTCIEAMCRMKC